MAAASVIKRLFAVAALLFFKAQDVASNPDFVKFGGVLLFNAVNESCSFHEDRSHVWDLLEDYIDHATLDQVFPQSTSRALRLGSRKLPISSHCKLCGKYCFFGAANGCFRPLGRRLDDEATMCMKYREELDKKLGETEDKVKERPSCLALLRSRSVKCYQKNQLCHVVNVALEGNKVVDPMKKDIITTFTKTQNVTFRADTIYAHGEVTFVVRNARSSAVVANHTRNTHPFYFLGSKTATASFAVGNYTMEVIPGYDRNATFTVPFRVTGS